MHPVNGGFSVTPQGEDYCPHRALAASVILRALQDYCEAKGIESNYEQVWKKAEKERNFRIRDQQRTRERRIARGVNSCEMKEIESTESIADKWINIAKCDKEEAHEFLTGGSPKKGHKTVTVGAENGIDWFQECGMPYFTQKKLHFCYTLHQKGSLSQTSLEEICRAKKAGDDAEKQS